MARLLFLFGCAGMLLMMAACGGGVKQTATTTKTRSPVVTPAIPTYPSAVRFGDIELTPISLAIGKPAVKGFGDAVAIGEDDVLVLAVRVANLSTTKRIEFGGWPNNLFRMNGRSTDEHGNGYRMVTYPFGTKLIGDEKGGSINPGEAAQAVIVFEKPIDAAQVITIALDGNGVAANNAEFAWKISRADWTH